MRRWKYLLKKRNEGGDWSGGRRPYVISGKMGVTRKGRGVVLTEKSNGNTKVELN